MDVGGFRSSLCGDLIYLAENVCRPVAQNVLGHKEFIRSRRQGMGEGLRKAGGGTIWYDLQKNL